MEAENPKKSELSLRDERFGKAYKLCSKKAIDALFKKRKGVKQFPFIFTYDFMELPTDKCFQVVLSVPKRIVRKAHDRNRIKRVIREVFRKNKLILEDFLATSEQQVALFVTITQVDQTSYAFLEQKMKAGLHKLVEELKSKKA